MSEVTGAELPSLDAVPAIVVERLPQAFVRDHVLLVTVEDDVWIAWCGAHTDALAIWNAGVRLGRPLQERRVTAETLVPIIDALYETAASTPTGTGDAVGQLSDAITVDGGQLDFDRLLDQAERDLLRTDGKAPLVQLVDRLLFDAVRMRASDLHIQPLPDHIVVRHRVDGVLDDGRQLPIAFLRPIVSRIKVLGGLDVAERLIPQDGRCSVRIGARAIDIRISTLPTPHGERVVLRLLDTGADLHEFAGLGMPNDVAGAFLGAARRSSGIVLVTGPTGSGKTTTLYATLRELDARERNIMTIEDPIEYELDTLGLPISQSQVNAKKGVTFANGLRHLLRQDPDIIMVGEIRDAETAATAIQASLTGHLVFSTLHTTDAPSAVTRLIDLGVEPYLVGASLSAVLAQRLVRLCCPACGGPEQSLNGCAECGHTGYQGRLGVFELLQIDEALRTAIGDGAALEELRSIATATGHRSLLEAGKALVDAGRTTMTEIERVIHGGAGDG